MAGDEFDFIEQALRPLTRGHPAALELRDDAAVLAPEPGTEQVLAKDMLVAGRHFPDKAPAQVIAQRTLGSNLSDLAAMGASPIGYLMAVAFPESWGFAQKVELAKAFGAAGEGYDLPLLGGDTTVGADRLTLSLTLLGSVPTGQALQRSGARVDDWVWVSGHIGDAALGLEIALGEADDEAHLRDRFENPRPRLALGEGLRGIASACIDISDGLVADAGHLARASGVSLEIALARIPFSAPALARVETREADAIPALLAGGDDYELLFTAPASSTPALEALSGRVGVTLTPIGHVKSGEGAVILGPDGRALSFDKPGFTHF